MKPNRSRKHQTLGNNLDKRTSMAILPVILPIARNLGVDVVSETSFKSHSWATSHGLVQFLLTPSMLRLPQLPAARSSMNKLCFFWTTAEQTKQCLHRWCFGFPPRSPQSPPQLQTVMEKMQNNLCRHLELSTGTEDMPRALIQPATLCWSAHSSSGIANINQRMEKEGFQFMLCSGTTAVTELTPMPVLSLPQPQPFLQCFLQQFPFSFPSSGTEKGKRRAYNILGQERNSPWWAFRAGCCLWNHGYVQASLYPSIPETPHTSIRHSRWMGSRELSAFEMVIRGRRVFHKAVASEGPRFHSLLLLRVTHSAHLSCKASHGPNDVIQTRCSIRFLQDKTATGDRG